MPKKRPPILKRAWDLFTLSFPHIDRLKKPINRNLIIFKKTRKIKTLKLLKHYTYTYIEEYQFSPPSTPLSNHSIILFKNRTRRPSLCSMFLLCGCSGNSKFGGDEDAEIDELNAPATFDDIGSEPNSPPWLSELEEEAAEEESVDRRAEKFIERFYEEMRMQRQESIMQYTEMLDRNSA